MSYQRSFRLARPKCPSCKSDDVHLLKTLRNYLAIVADIVCGFFLYTPFSYKLRCGRCGFEYRADIKDV